MAAAAHTPGGYGGVPQKVGKEFNKADAGTGIIGRGKGRHAVKQGSSSKQAAGKSRRMRGP
jgi:hypothetical protein